MTEMPRRRWLIAVAAIGALALLAGCGGGSDAADTTTTAAKATTTTEAEATTSTTEAAREEVAEPVTSGLPTDEDVAPSGDWIGLRFLAAQDPSPSNFQPGSADARVYSITPDCSGGEACTLVLEGGGDGGSFALPNVAPITGDPIVLEPDGDSWTYELTYPDAVGCTDDLDGPYLETTETRDLEPVYDEEGTVTGLVGTTVFVDTLNEAGRNAGCPASVEGTYGYATVVAPSSGIADLREYEVDGEFRQTLEVTSSEGYSDASYQVGGINTTLPGHDVTLEGSCADGDCSVDFSQVSGDDSLRQTTLESDDGLSLAGIFDDTGGCNDDDTGERLFDDGAYTSAGSYEDLIPVWVEDGEVKAFVGRYFHLSKPTELGKTEPSCSYEQRVGGWAYLVDTSIFDG
ncbi:MAG: hypothetical protein R2702_00285 [Acidimicrobiales bacterium]